MLDLDLLARDLSARPVEALIADVSLVPVTDLSRLVRLLGPNRPLIVVGEAAKALEAVPRDVTWIDRPATHETFLLSVALALAEGRPARRSPRKIVPKLPSQVDGVSAKVLDVSAEGVRLEVSGTAALPPFFTLRVPGFGVTAKVKRVWVAMPNQGALWCGGIIDRGQSAKGEGAWSQFLENAPSTAGVTLIRS